MALKDQIFSLCNKLAENGWRDMILSVTNNELDIKQDSAEKLKEALLKPITIDRTFSGFEDYRLDGNQGIAPLSFSKSLIYHALASPDVAGPNLTYYPSLEELDLVENFIHSNGIKKEADSNNLAKLKAIHGTKLVVAVFAYQYRTWEGSSHRVHADMNYSRTGISRIGNSEAFYDAKRRSFWVGDNDGEINTLPCKYGAFLAIHDTVRNLSTSFNVMDKESADDNLTVLVPIQKLFSGGECLTDLPELKLQFEAFHRNEKLKRVHQRGLPNFIPIDEQRYDINAFPFVIDDNTKPGFLCTHLSLIGSTIVKPTKGKIVEPAIQGNNYVAFKVPRIDSDNRFNSSYQILAKSRARKSPEYVNIRQTLPNGITINNPTTDIIDINNLNADNFNQMLNNGGYNTVHFIDKTSDGFVKIQEFSGLKSFAAYSLIAAIDFFPLVNQREINKWHSFPEKDPQRQFNQGGPLPLSSGRIKANINYPQFQSDTTRTHTVVLSSSRAKDKNDDLVEKDNDSLSYLPDGASSIYQPGWDISMDVENGVPFNAAYGLGSPFPEDAKLCAALNSFWPAAAPDASRTFFASETFSSFPKQPTAIPLTDEELGVYPKEAQRIGITSKRGWDGEYGPFLETTGNGEFVNYADIARSDYTRSAWEGHMHMDLLKSITTSQLIKRMEALRKCILELLQPTFDTIISNNLWLVSFQEIQDWSERNDRMNAQLKGKGFRFIFITPIGNTPIADGTDIKRLRMKVDKKFECQLDENTFLWREITQIHAIALNEGDIPMVNLISNLS